MTSAREAAKRAAAEKAHRKVFQLEHNDPLDPLFKLPDWVPAYFISRHRTCLKKLLKDYSSEQIGKGYVRYKEQLTTDHARQKALTPDERDKARGSGYWLPIRLSAEFRDLAHILWALEIGATNGPQQGRLALEGDPEDVRLWQLGKKNDAAVKAGGAARRTAFEPIKKEQSEKFKEALRRYHQDNPNHKFTVACQYIAK